MEVGRHTKRESRVVRQFIVGVDTSGHGKMNGNLENSSITFKKYFFLLFDDSGPLKSMLILWNGWVALIR